MRNAKTLAIVVALGLGLIFSSPLVAQAKKGGGGGTESQAGGLPALEDRVEADEALITTLQGLITTLQTQVAALQTQVAALQALIATLQAQVADLLGQNQFACVAADGTLGNHSGGVTSALLGTGQFEVDFGKDVHACAAVATIGTNSASAPTTPIAMGFISVAGDPSATTDPADGGADSDGVFVQTANTAGTLTSLGFCLYVSCP